DRAATPHHRPQPR
nr:Chain CCC, MGC0122 [Homo sapiens]7P5U_EEE Chain EEE, MGC0122 [Homo sapiens]